MAAGDEVTAGAAPRATLRAAQRLRSQRDFRRVYQRGRRASGQWISVVVLPRTGGDGVARSRLGVSVSKDHGAAVRRNKIKRLLREAWRLERHRLPCAVDVVLIPRQRSEKFPLAELRAEIVALVVRALEDRRERPRRRRP